MTDLHDDQESLLDLENVSDMSLDDIEDLPSYITPPPGIYVLATHAAKISKVTDRKTQQEKKRINHTYVICKAIQLVDQNELIPEAGSLVGETFTMNQKGLEVWKVKARGILGQERLKGMTIGDVLDDLTQNQYLFVGRARIKVSKGDDGKEYENVQIQVVREATPEDLEGAVIPAVE